MKTKADIIEIIQRWYIRPERDFDKLANSILEMTPKNLPEWNEMNPNSALPGANHYILEQQPEVSEDRPIIKEYFKKGTTLNDIQKVYLSQPELFSYAQALDMYIDSLQSHHPQPINEEKVKAIVTEITGMENKYDVPFKLFQAVGSNVNCRLVYVKCLRAVELTLTELGLNKD